MIRTLQIPFGIMTGAGMAAQWVNDRLQQKLQEETLTRTDLIKRTSAVDKHPVVSEAK